MLYQKDHKFSDTLSHDAAAVITTEEIADQLIRLKILLLLMIHILHTQRHQIVFIKAYAKE